MLPFDHHDHNKSALALTYLAVGVVAIAYWGLWLWVEYSTAIQPTYSPPFWVDFPLSPVWLLEQVESRWPWTTNNDSFHGLCLWGYTISVYRQGFGMIGLFGVVCLFLAGRLAFCAYVGRFPLLQRISTFCENDRSFILHVAFAYGVIAAHYGLWGWYVKLEWGAYFGVLPEEEYAAMTPPWLFQIARQSEAWGLWLFVSLDFVFAFLIVSGAICLLAALKMILENLARRKRQCCPTGFP